MKEKTLFIIVMFSVVVTFAPNLPEPVEEWVGGEGASPPCEGAGKAASISLT